MAPEGERREPSSAPTASARSQALDGHLPGQAAPLRHGPGPAGSAPGSRARPPAARARRPPTSLGPQGGPAVPAPASTPRPSSKRPATRSGRSSLAAAAGHSVILWTLRSLLGLIAWVRRRGGLHRAKLSAPQAQASLTCASVPGRLPAYVRSCGLSPRGQRQHPAVPKMSPQGRRRGGPGRSRRTPHSRGPQTPGEGALKAPGQHSRHSGPSGWTQAPVPLCPGLGLCTEASPHRDQTTQLTRSPTRPAGAPAATEMPSAAPTAPPGRSRQRRGGGLQPQDRAGRPPRPQTKSAHTAPGVPRRLLCLARWRTSARRRRVPPPGREKPAGTAHPRLTAPGPEDARCLCCHTGQGILCGCRQPLCSAFESPPRT